MSDVPSEGGGIEQRERRETIVAWIVVLLLVVAMFLRAGLSWWMFPDRPRPWQYRARPYVPGEAYASTRPASRRTTGVPPQVRVPPRALSKESP